MSYTFERGKVLLEQGRYAEAEKEFKQTLSENPNHAFALALLAECRIADKDFAKAIEYSEKAVGVEPNMPFFLYIMARAYFYSQKTKRAREVISEGLRLSPTDPDFYALRASVNFYEDDWQSALDDAETGLSFDAENVDLINLRAQALVKLRRKDEADETLNYALNKAPENSYSHANKGWVAIERDKYEEAVTHFKEALRLNPENKYAKEGLKEAIKAKNFLYRGVLKYFLWMNKLTSKAQWYFIIGIYILYQIIIQMADKYPSIAGYLAPLILAYILFAFSSWIAKPVSNLFLRLHPLAKHVLDDDEKLGSTLVGAFAVAGFGCLATFYLTGNNIEFKDGNIYISIGGELLFHLTIFFLVMLIPLGGLFNSTKGTKARRNLTIYVAAIGVFGLIGALTYAGWALNLFFLGVLVFSFAANYIIMKSAKDFST